MDYTNRQYDESVRLIAKRPSRFTLLPDLFVALLFLGLMGFGAEGPSMPEPPDGASSLKPVLSARLSGHYDDNVYLQDVGDLSKRESWVTSIRPVAGFAWKRQAESIDFTLKLDYEPEFRFFHQEPSEDYLRHIGVFAFDGVMGGWSTKAALTVSYTDGSTESMTWVPPGFIPALGGYEIRNRRRNLQTQEHFHLRYDWETWFARGVYDGRTWDFMIEQRPTPFYQNFVDRDDLNGGLDAGWKSRSGAELFVGYRFGHQDQALNPYRPPHSYENDYQRVLLGADVRLWRWLTLKAEGGPSVHQFDPVTVRPGASDLEVLGYYRATLEFAIAASTQLTLTGRQGLIPGSLGGIAYENIRLRAVFKQSLADRLNLLAGVQIDEFDFLAPVARRDRLYTPSLGLEYRFTSRLSAGAFYRHAWSESQVPNLPGRDYTRNIIGFQVSVQN